MPESSSRPRAGPKPERTPTAACAAAGSSPACCTAPRASRSPVAVSPKEIGTILRSATGENTLFDLDLGGRRRKVILKEFQRRAASRASCSTPTSTRSRSTSCSRSRSTSSSWARPSGSRSRAASLDFVTRELEVECLPADIPEKIMVDISRPRARQAHPRRRPQGPGQGHVLTEPDVVIAHVVAPRAEEVVAGGGGEGAAAKAGGGRARGHQEGQGHGGGRGAEEKRREGEKKAEKKEKK